jgi:hypothetical protein
MFNTPFKHGVIKNTILTFGALFGNIKILRHNASNNIEQVIAVPITYGPKEKILVRLNQDPNFDNQVMVTLPRMAFEITSVNFDSSRVINKNQKIVCHKNDGSVQGTFAPVPYNLNIALYLLTKGTEDGLDVMEQILPAFMPEYTAKVRVIPGLNITQDIPFTLNGVSTMDDYEGDFSTRRLVTTTFDFTAKINLYGNVSNANTITRTDVPIFDFNATLPATTHVSAGDPETGEVVQDFWS